MAYRKITIKMAYEVIMGLSASYAIVFVGTFTEYPYCIDVVYKRECPSCRNEYLCSAILCCQQCFDSRDGYAVSLEADKRPINIKK